VIIISNVVDRFDKKDGLVIWSENDTGGDAPEE